MLYCAILLHDVAKGLPGDHSDVGAEIAQSLCPRLGLSADDTAAVAWLVKNHLVMSDTAQRRDVSDPKTVRDFVAMVQSPEMLRLLLVLTVADIRAVGPGVWNGWKGQLLRELYYAAEQHDDGRRPGAVTRQRGWLPPRRRWNERLGRFHAGTARAGADPPLRQLLAGVRRRRAGAPRAADHQGRCRGPAAGAGQPTTNAFRAITEIILYTPDHAGLFSQFAGAIAMAGGSIVDAKAFTTCDGFALDVFSVQDAEGEPFSDPERLGRLRQTIERTLRGESAPPARTGPQGCAQPRQRLHHPAKDPFRQ